MRKNLICLMLAFVLVAVFALCMFFVQGRTDTRPPVLSFSGTMLELSTKDPDEAYMKGVSAVDKRDGDVTASVVVESVRLVSSDGTIEITYAAFDTAGNVRKAVRTARYTDYESPRFYLNRSLTFAQNSGFDIFRVVEARDALDGDISHRVRINSLDETSVATLGMHELELRVSNSMGEMVKLVVPVEVYAAGTYEATLSLTDYLIYLPAGAQLDPERFLDTYSRSNLRIPLGDGVPEGVTLQVKNNVRTDVPGVYTVEYRVTQTVGMQNYTGYAKLIVVVEG